MSEYNVVHGDLKGVRIVIFPTPSKIGLDPYCLLIQANVLITADGKACISDFGIASIQDNAELPPLMALNAIEQQAWFHRCRTALQEGGRSQTLASTLSSRMSSFSGAGTYRWMAPERLIPEELGLPSAKPTFASDVYSWAMLALEVIILSVSSLAILA